MTTSELRFWEYQRALASGLTPEQVALTYAQQRDDALAASATDGHPATVTS